MGFPTKVQLICRKASEQYYINFPSAVAQAMEFAKGETVEWIIADKGHLILARKDVPPNPIDIQKNSTPHLNERLQQLIATATDLATPTEICADRLARHMLGTLLTPEKSTVTNLIRTHGGQDRDWTADYRLYSKDRVDESHLFDQARESLLETPTTFPKPPPPRPTVAPPAMAHSPPPPKPSVPTTPFPARPSAPPPPTSTCQ